MIGGTGAISAAVAAHALALGHEVTVLNRGGRPASQGAAQLLCDIREEGALLGDKCQTAVFDNRKLKSYVPGFACQAPFERGIEASMRYFESHPELCQPDTAWDERADAFSAAYL